MLASATTWFVGHFFPPALDAATRAANFADLSDDLVRGDNAFFAASGWITAQRQPSTVCL